MDVVKDFLGGFSGGAVSTLLLHPFDLVRNRQAVADGYAKRPTYKNQFSILRSVLKNDGVRALWRGVTPGFIGAGMSWGLYFPVYNLITDKLKQHQNGQMPGYQYFFSGCLAGTIVLSLTNPIWVAKTQQCLQYETGALKRSKAESLPETLFRLWRSERFYGLYRGFYAGVLGTVHGGVQFYFLELFKKWLKVDRNNQTNFEMIVIPAASKMIAATICYPQLLVRSRMQDQHRKYETMRGCVSATFKNEGIQGFYKGLTTNLCRTVPASIITFYTYELIKKSQR